MKKIVLIILFIVFYTNLFGVEYDFSPAKSENVGFMIYDISKQKIVEKHNADTEFSYASNIKLLTAAAALEYLGGGFRFVTLFLYKRKTGTLYIKSGGDSSLVVERMWHIAKELKLKGVKKINKVVVDDFLYGKKSMYKIPGAENGDHAYQAFISPLAVNFNSVEISITPSSLGKPVNVHVTTPGSYFVVTNSSKTVRGGENRLVIGTKKNGRNTEIVIKGTYGIKRKRPRRLYKKVFSPTHHYISTLMNLLKGNESVLVERKRIPLSFFDKKNGIVYRYKSDPLRDVLKIMNRYSSNFVADSLQFFMGAIFTGDSNGGVSILKQYAKQQLNHDVDIINGSGLGNGQNSLTPQFLISLLKHVDKDKFKSVDFYASLPVIGEDGTLKKVSKESYRGMVRAKTGSLTGVSSLSGIMKAKSGGLYLFTFVVNNYPSRSFKKMWKYRDKFIEQIWENF